MAIVIFGNYVLLNPLIVRGDAAETARKIMAHQTQLRLALVCFLTYSVITVVFSAASFVILKPVNWGVALAGALFRLVFAMMWLLTSLNFLGALRLLGNAGYLQVFETDRLQALARVSLAAPFDDYYVGLPFFGLSATIFAYLFLRSGYIPTALAGFGLISSAWCVVCAFTFLLFPGFGTAVNPYWFDTAMGIYELVLGLWLIIKGINLPVANQASISNH
jgi:hypothetical protein